MPKQLERDILYVAEPPPEPAETDALLLEPDSVAVHTADKLIVELALAGNESL